MSEDEKPYPPPSDMTDYYTGVGRISMAWAYFELHVNLTIWELANVSQQFGACITSHIGNPSARFRALIALVQLRGGTDDHYKTLNSLGGTADGLGRQRNRLIHDPSSRETLTDGTRGNFVRLEITADRTLKFGMQPVDLKKDFEKLDNEIKAITEAYQIAISKILAELPTFSRREFQRQPRIDLGLPATQNIDPIAR